MRQKKPNCAGERLAYHINETVALTGLSRSTINKLITPGRDGTPPRLRSVKVGRTRLIPIEAIDHLLSGDDQ
jgi:hypothetical protein